MSSHTLFFSFSLSTLFSSILFYSILFIGLDWIGFIISIIQLIRLWHEKNRDTGKKLGLATFLMFTIPFVAFFGGMVVFADKQHPDNWAGGCAIVATNLIIGGYCYSAFMEVDNDEEPRYDDADGPKTGAFKHRTD